MNLFLDERTVFVQVAALRREARSGGHLEGNSAESKEMRTCLLRQSTMTSELGDEASDAVNGV